MNQQNRSGDDYDEKPITILKRNNEPQEPAYVINVIYNDKDIYLSKQINTKKKMFGL